jgi:predicted AlkP superfamily pyrophosphatase or phosphodiesterase
MLFTSLLIAGLINAPEPRNVVIIGWDGTQREHLMQMIERKEVPNLIRLKGEGGMVDITVTTGATDTKAGWSQILTGYKPETTGVYSNARYRAIPKGLSIFERAEEFFGKDEIYTAMIVAKKGHVDNDRGEKIPYARWVEEQLKKHPKAKADVKNPEVREARWLKQAGGTVVEENGAKFVETPGKPWSVAQDGMDLFRNGLTENAKVADLAMETIDKQKDKRMLLFVHFAHPDPDGHKNGENSQSYTDGIKQDDEWTGKIVAKLKEAGVYDRTTIYIVADHGFDEGLHSHRNAPYVFCATNDKRVKRNGDRADIAPTVLKRLGLDLSKLTPPLDGKPLDE